MSPSRPRPEIPGTTLFDGRQAMKGYALNKMCFSLNDAANRHAFLHDEDAYMDRYELTDAQRDAVKRRDVLGMLDAGGNVYYLAKLAGALGLGVQDLGDAGAMRILMQSAGSWYFTPEGEDHVEPEVIEVPTGFTDRKPLYGHLFGVKHHGILSVAKAEAPGSCPASRSRLPTEPASIRSILRCRSASQSRPRTPTWRSPGSSARRR